MWKDEMIELCNENLNKETNQFLDYLIDKHGLSIESKEQLLLIMKGFYITQHEILTIKDQLK